MRDRPELCNGARVPYEAPIAELAAMLKGPAPERWAAFVTLAHMEDLAALNLLAEAAETADAHVRRAALEAIAQHPAGERWNP